MYSLFFFGFFFVDSLALWTTGVVVCALCSGLSGAADHWCGPLVWWCALSARGSLALRTTGVVCTLWVCAPRPAAAQAGLHACLREADTQACHTSKTRAWVQTRGHLHAAWPDAVAPLGLRRRRPHAARGVAARELDRFTGALPKNKDGNMFSTWAFPLISPARLHVRPVGRTCGGAGEIELTPIGVELNGWGHVPPTPRRRNESRLGNGSWSPRRRPRSRKSPPRTPKAGAA